MKKIFLLFAAVCAFVACDPTSEDIGNGGHITADELKAMSTVTVDKAPSGKNGNVISCTTSAPVNAKWDIGGKDFVGNYAKKKMKLGSYTVNLIGVCADGTEVIAQFPVTCEEITDPLQKIYIYGEDPAAQPPFVPANWVSNDLRFSDGEGAHFPFLSDDVYWGFKTLIFDIADASADLDVKVMYGWWDNFNADGSETHVKWISGLNELQLTESIAKVCAKGNGGQSHDLCLMVTSGSCTIKSVYYEE